MKTSTIYQSVLGLAIAASCLAGCATPRKTAEPPVAAAAVAPAPADIPADDTYVKASTKSPVDLGAASSGQGL